MKIAWFSAGITSAVACKLATSSMEDVEVFYIETGSHHPDNIRFLHDCENWYGKKINIVQSKKYDSVFDVIEQSRYINGPKGAKCTGELRVAVRQDLHNRLNPDAHIMGYEYDKHEMQRALNLSANYPTLNFLYPLIDAQLSKNECAGIVSNAGIKLPEMYKLGYDHNNCIGCVKGGAGYWNKIKVDFPDIFKKMSELEREIGASCINGTFLDELKPKRGRPPKKNKCWRMWFFL